MRIGKFICFALVLLISCRETVAKNNELKAKPFKATTVDECIDEVACFEYVFLNMMVPNFSKLTEGERQAYKFKRWKDNLRVIFIDVDGIDIKKSTKFKNDFLAITDEVDDYTGKKIKFTNDIYQANTYVFIARDYAEKEEIIQRFRSKLPSVVINEMKNKDLQSSNILKVDRENYYKHGLIFMTEKDIENGCYFKTLSNYLGVNYNEIGTLGLSNHNECEINNLHKLILTFQHTRQMVPGANVDEMTETLISFHDAGLKQSNQYKINLSTLLEERMSAKEKGLPISR